MTRATDDVLDQLHAITFEATLELIRRYKNGEVLDSEGNKIPLPASVIAAAGKLLKDNGVDRAVRPGDPEDLLADELPDLPSNVSRFPSSRG